MLIVFPRRKYERIAVKIMRVPDSIILVLAATHFRDRPNDEDQNDDGEIRRRKKEKRTARRVDDHCRVGGRGRSSGREKM